MSYTPKELRRVLLDSGLEVFRVKDDEVHLAERQNLHLMEAGVRIRCGESYGVTIVARAQRSDAAARHADEQFALVREGIRDILTAGFVEKSADSRTLYSVSDSTQVVDVWYEITVYRDFADVEAMIAGVRHALSVERYISVPE